MMVTLANSLSARHYAVDVLLVQAKGPFMGQLSNNVQIVNLNRQGVLQSIPALTNYLRRQNPQTLLAHFVCS